MEAAVHAWPATFPRTDGGDGVGMEATTSGEVTVIVPAYNEAESVAKP